MNDYVWNTFLLLVRKDGLFGQKRHILNTTKIAFWAPNTYHATINILFNVWNDQFLIPFQLIYIMTRFEVL